MTTTMKPLRTQRTQRPFFFAFSAFSAVLSLCVLDAQTPSPTRRIVETLASPRLEGRLAGTNGETLASDFLVAELQKIGAKPLPGQKDFRLPFEFTAGTKDGGAPTTLDRNAAPPRA